MPSFPDGRHSGKLVPPDRANVDTDAIFPKQYGRSTARSGHGLHAVLDIEAAHPARRPWPDRMLEN